MKQTTLFYFSGTGNTMWVANQIKDDLIKKGLKCNAVSIESITMTEAETYITSSDIIGFGYPIYGSDLPEPMKKFINRLAIQKNSMPAFVFCTQMVFSGDGSFVYAKTLKQKNFDIRQTDHINMPNNISITPFPFRILPEKKKLRVLNKAKQRINRFSSFIVENKPRYKGKYGYLLGIMQRGPYRSAYASFQDLLSVDKEKCIQCGRCARLCPVNNITLIDNYPSFNKSCALCLRCYNFCPTTAILYNKNHHNQKKALYRGPDKDFKPENLKRAR